MIGWPLTAGTRSDLHTATATCRTSRLTPRQLREPCGFLRCVSSQPVRWRPQARACTSPTGSASSSPPSGSRVERAPRYAPKHALHRPPAPPIVIGKWEDRIGTSWTQEIRIVVRAGHIVRETTLPGGRVDRDILTEVAPHANERKRFENPSSTRGQAYAITRHGHLAIFDDDGFIHQATKVTTSGEQR